MAAMPQGAPVATHNSLLQATHMRRLYARQCSNVVETIKFAQKLARRSNGINAWGSSKEPASENDEDDEEWGYKVCGRQQTMTQTNLGIAGSPSQSDA